MRRADFPWEPIRDAEPFDMPDVELSTEAPRPLFDSRESWAEQTRRLRERKALGGDDDDPG